MTKSEHIGQRIKQARKAQDMKRIELAVAAGLTSNTIRNYEEGYTKVPAENLARIALALDADVLWLLQGDKEAA